MKTNRVVDFGVCATALLLLPPVLALAALFLKMQARGKVLSDRIVSMSYSWFDHVNSPAMYVETGRSGGKTRQLHAEGRGLPLVG